MKISDKLRTMIKPKRKAPDCMPGCDHKTMINYHTLLSDFHARMKGRVKKNSHAYKYHDDETAAHDYLAKVHAKWDKAEPKLKIVAPTEEN